MHTKFDNNGLFLSLFWTKSIWWHFSALCKTNNMNRTKIFKDRRKLEGAGNRLYRDTFNTSLVMGYIKVFAWRWWSSDHSNLAFLRTDKLKMSLQELCAEPMLCQNQHLSCMYLIFESGVWFLCMTQHLTCQTLLHIVKIAHNILIP